MARAIPAVTATAAGLLAMALATGWGLQQLAPGAAEDGEAAAAVVALTRDTTPAPARPGPAPSSAGSACSSPFGATAYDFDAACARHDRGYALLRVAADRGRPLGDWARAVIDGRFRRDLADRCAALPADDRGACTVAAETYADAVALNSWRQGYGVPVHEQLTGTLVPAALSGFATAALAFAGAAVQRARHLAVRAVSRLALRPGGRLLGRLRGRLAEARARFGAPAVGTVLGLAASVQPGVLPRPLWIQVLLGGVLGAHGYAAGLGARGVARVVVRWSRRTALARFGAGARVRAAGRVGRRMTPVALALLLAAAVGSATTAQARLAALDGTPAPTTAGELAALTGGAALAVLLVRLPRVARVARRRRAVSRPPRVAWVVPPRPRQSVFAGSTAVLLAVTALTATAGAAPTEAAATGAAATGAAATGAAQEASSVLVSGSALPADLDGEGARFLRAQIPAGTGSTPLRIYAPLQDGVATDAAATAAVAALERAGGLDRSTVLIAVPTGSGWVDPAAVTALEHRLGGDVATVAVQYAAVPSWLAYLRSGMGVQEATRAVSDALQRRLDARPAADRPRVLLFGESLGAWGGLTAYPATAGLPPVADAALWAGLPTDVRAATPDGVSRQVDGRRVLVLDHADDPVTTWTPQLLVAPQTGWRQPWLPLVSFWVATGDVITARSVPAGHGHVYDRELEGAWSTLLAG